METGAEKRKMTNLIQEQCNEEELKASNVFTGPWS